MTRAVGRLEWTLLATPLAGLAEPDDACLVREAGGGSGFRAVLVGPAAHGEAGRRARRRALAALRGGGDGGLFPRIHRALAGTTGASVGVIGIAAGGGCLTLEAIGSIRAVVGGGAEGAGEGPTRFAGAPGIVGVGRPIPPAALELAGWRRGGWAVVACDGLLERWDLERLDGGPRDSLDRIVAELRRGGRDPDDGAALVLRLG